MNKFNKKQNRSLTEIYRRLNYFHKGNLNERLMYLAYPSEAKVLRDLGLIQPYSSEIRRALNWYSLTERGKRFFSKYIAPINEEENQALINGEYIIFNIELYLQSWIDV